MKEINTSIEINADPVSVWRQLIDFAGYSAWNPFIRFAEGEISEGARLRVTIQVPGRRAMTFRPILRRVDEEYELRWLGHFLIPGIFDG
ncbi:MAG: SRPBCC family protein, partial [Bacteroidota bacterium]